MNLLRNLTNYRAKGMREIEMDGRMYITNPEAKPSMIIGLALGESLEKGSPNYLISLAATDARKYFGKNLPVMVQSEIGKCLSGLEEKNFYSVDDVYNEFKENKSLALSAISTKEVMELAVSEAKRKGFDLSSIIYIAGPQHMERVLALGEKMGLSGDPFTPSEVTWSPNDTQIWVRSPYLWIPREILTREHHNLKKWT